MPAFIHGLSLCEGFFLEAAKPILDEDFPQLRYTAGVIGYGSDVLGYDDETSRDHMWGPRFYLFLNERDLSLSETIMKRFSTKLPYSYKGYSINFSEPNPNNCGVRHPQLISNGAVSPLIWMDTPEHFIEEYLGKYPPEAYDLFDWLAFSEHRLLGLTRGRLFVDSLGMETIRKQLHFYPEPARLYLLASQWSLIAEEQAFVSRCAEAGDQLGSKLVCSRAVERLMRLCFLYCNQYAPYAKWFGTAFSKLPISDLLKGELTEAVFANEAAARENHLLNAELLIARLHNESGLTDPVESKIESYYGRKGKVIFAERFAEALLSRLVGSPLEKQPLIGSFSEVANWSGFMDEPCNYIKIKKSLMQLQ